MRHGVAVGVTAIAALLVLAAPAAAQPMPAPWDGANPFNCQNQDVGTGVDFPDPGADPFCVEFDKTQQNVTDLGIVDFLSKEPARVAAAVAKCFYFQHDHWTGSIVQGEQPEIWHWDGSYFFDKATGEGGVSLHNLRIGGQPADATPYVPDPFKPYIYPGGGGGGQLVNDLPADPTCAALVDTPEERAQIYYHLQPGGPVTGGNVGPAKLRTKRADVLKAFGPAHETTGATDRYNVEGGGQLRLGYHSLAPGVAAILTTAPGNSFRGVKPGGSGSAAVKALRATVVFNNIRGAKVYEVPRVPYRLLLGVRSGKVAYLALVDPKTVPGPTSLRRNLERLS